jgi:hypothetical protein
VIHDREFATPPEDFRDFLWRIQYLAELGVGRLLRQEQRSEADVARAIREKLA